MIEELLIKIKSTLDSGGFTKAEASMRGLQGTSKQALGEAAAHSNFFNAEMNKTPGILGRAKNSMNQLGISTKQLGIGMVAAGGAIIGAYAMIAYAAVQSAAASEANWGKFAVNMGEGGMAADKFRAKYNDLANDIAMDTGRLKGEVVDTLGKLARVGIRSEEALKGSSEAITALAYKMGESDIGAMADKYVAALNKPGLEARSMNKLGVSIADVTQVMKDQGLTIEDWKNLTVEQRDQILKSTVAMEGGADANERMKNSAQGMMNQLTNLYNNFMTQLGYALLPTLLAIAKAVVPIAKAFLDWFSSLPGPAKTVLVLLPLLLGVLLLIGGAVLLLAPFAPALLTIGGALGIVTTEAGVTTLALSGILVPLLAIAGIAAAGAIVIDIVYHLSKGEGGGAIDSVSSDLSQLVNPMFGHAPISAEGYRQQYEDDIGKFTENDPLAYSRWGPKYNKGTQQATQQAQGTHDYLWGASGNTQAWFGGIGRSVQSGAGDIGNYLTGNGGGIPAQIKNFKFPTVADILNMLKSKIPMLNWKIPSIPQLIQRIAQFIHNLNWKIPAIADLIAKIGQYITQLLWNIPGVGDVIGIIKTFIDQLHWNIPSAGQLAQAAAAYVAGVAGGDGTNVAGGDMLNNTAGATKSIKTSSAGHVTHNHISIGNIADKETADYTVNKLVNALSHENKVSGR